MNNAFLKIEKKIEIHANIIRKVFNKTTIIWRLITYFVVPKWRLTQTSESVNIYHRHRKIKNYDIDQSFCFQSFFKSP
jgi:hypothetical protein